MERETTGKKEYEKPRLEKKQELAEVTEGEEPIVSPGIPRVPV